MLFGVLLAGAERFDGMFHGGGGLGCREFDEDLTSGKGQQRRQ